jgi:hypothetical protein
MQVSDIQGWTEKEKILIQMFFSLSSFKNFRIIAFALRSIIQTTTRSIVTVIGGRTSMNQLANKIGHSPSFCPWQRSTVAQELIFF